MSEIPVSPFKVSIFPPANMHLFETQQFIYDEFDQRISRFILWLKPQNQTNHTSSA
jgi:hypothetical protein